MNLRKRLANLEREFAADPIELLMPNGQTVVLDGYTTDRVTDLCSRAMREMNGGNELSADVALVRSRSPAPKGAGE